MRLPPGQSLARNARILRSVNRRTVWSEDDCLTGCQWVSILPEATSNDGYQQARADFAAPFPDAIFASVPAEQFYLLLMLPVNKKVCRPGHRRQSRGLGCHDFPDFGLGSWGIAGGRVVVKYYYMLQGTVSMLESGDF